MEPFAQMLSDVPKDFKKQTSDIIPDDAAAFKDNAWNHNSTRAASLMTFVRCYPPSSRDQDQITMGRC